MAGTIAALDKRGGGSGPTLAERALSLASKSVFVRQSKLEILLGKHDRAFSGLKSKVTTAFAGFRSNRLSVEIY